MRAESVAASFLPWTENSTLAEVKRRGYLIMWPKGTGTFGVPRVFFVFFFNKTDLTFEMISFEALIMVPVGFTLLIGDRWVLGII